MAETLEQTVDIDTDKALDAAVDAKSGASKAELVLWPKVLRTLQIILQIPQPNPTTCRY